MKKTYIIKQKMSGTGNIHDIASDLYDREIVFQYGCKYAIVLASHYGGKGYTTHRTESAAIAAYKRNTGYSRKIIDTDGNLYAVCGDQLILN